MDGESKRCHSGFSKQPNSLLLKGRRAREKEKDSSTETHDDGSGPEQKKEQAENAGWEMRAKRVKGGQATTKQGNT